MMPRFGTCLALILLPFTAFGLGLPGEKAVVATCKGKECRCVLSDMTREEAAVLGIDAGW